MTRIRRIHSIDDLRDIAEKDSLPIGFVDKDWRVGDDARECFEDRGC